MIVKNIAEPILRAPTGETSKRACPAVTVNSFNFIEFDLEHL